MPLLESIHYPKHSISRVVFKAEFAPLEALRQTPPSEFHRSVQVLYPIREDAPPASPAHPSWRFSSADRKRTITVTPDSFTFELLHYKDFKDFETASAAAFSVFSGLYSPLALTGFSVRFVNLISLPGRLHDWKGIVSDALVHVCNHFVWDKKEISRFMSQVVFDKEDHIILFNYGEPNDALPAKMTKREFVLDIECRAGAVAESEIGAKLKDFHGEIQSLFESSIDNGLREIFRGAP